MTALPIFPWPPGPAGTPPPRYSGLRNDDPVARVTLADGTPVWLLTRFADVQQVLTDRRFSRYQAAVQPGAGLGRGQGSGIVDLDPPEHTRYRSPIEAAFDVGRVMRYRDRIADVAEELLEGLGDEADLVADYTSPLAGRVTCELLGVTGDEWRELTSDVETQVSAETHPEHEVARAGERIQAVLAALLARARSHPADDVATTLVQTADLTLAERSTLLQGLVMSGFIGVRDLLARHLFAVLSTPGLAKTLQENPSRTPAAVEELLRYYPSSNDGLLRMATEEVVVGRTTLPTGALVLPLVSSASRDPQHFPGPDEIDIDRAAGESLVFGAGPHACPAADLARTMLRTGISCLLARFPGVRLAVPPESVEHTSDLIPLGIPCLPVVLTGTGPPTGSGSRTIR